MLVKEIPNGSYIDALHTGEYICLFWNSHCERGIFNNPEVTKFDLLTPLNDPLFLRITSIPELTLASQDHNSGNLLTWTLAGWKVINEQVGGKNPVIYDFSGKLYKPQPNTFADGWAYIDPETNLPVEAIKCHSSDFGLFDFVYLGQGIYVGQTDHGGTRVHINGESNLRILDDNAPVRITSDVNISTGKFALSYVDNENHKSVAYWGDLSELKSLPFEIPDNFGQASGQHPINHLISDTTRYVFSPTDYTRNKDHLMKQVSLGDNKYALVKFGLSTTYELLSKTDFGVELLEDASNIITVSSTDSRWLPKSMKVGYEHRFITGKHQLIEMSRNDCKEINKQDWFREMWIVSSYESFDCGPDLGKKKVIIVAHDNTNGAHDNGGPTGRNLELYYYAEDTGWIGWESHRSGVVFATGKPIFSEQSLWTRKLFYKNATSNVFPQLTGCAIELPPVPPPSQLKHPQVTVDNWSPEVKDGWEFKFHDRENEGFSARVYAENGSFYASFTNPVGTGKTGATRLYKKCGTTPPPIEPPPIPPAAISKIHVDGLTFRDEQNNIFSYRGFTSFLLYKRFLDGEDIIPYLKAWSGIGYNIPRVFAQVSWSQATGRPDFFPKDYSNYLTSLPSFFNLLSQHGLYCEFVDHTYPYNVDEQAQFSMQIAEIGAKHKNYFKELTNEPNVNGIDLNGIRARLNTSTWNFPWSSGNYDPPSQPVGSYLTCHLDRGPEWPRKFRQLLEYRQGGGPNELTDPAMNCPIVHDEPIGGADFEIPGRRSNVPSDFHTHGAGCQMHGAGGTFHHENGLSSIMPDGLEWDCAKAFITGLKLMPVQYQLGDYTRIGLDNCPIDTEQSLGSWGMVLGNTAVMVRVRPTGPFTVKQDWQITSIDSLNVVVTFTKK